MWTFDTNGLYQTKDELSSWFILTFKCSEGAKMRRKCLDESDWDETWNLDHKNLYGFVMTKKMKTMSNHTKMTINNTHQNHTEWTCNHFNSKDSRCWWTEKETLRAMLFFRKRKGGFYCKKSLLFESTGQK